MSRSLGGATAPTQDRISSNGDSPPSSRSALWSKEIVIAAVLCVLSALVIGAPKVGVLWGLSDETALGAHGDFAVPDHLTSKIGWIVSVAFVGVSGYLLAGNKYMAKHGIALVIPVNFVALMWYILMERSSAKADDGGLHLSTTLVHMEFLALWSTIGATIVAEHIMGLYRVSLFAPVIMTIFTLTLHTVSLPYLGAHSSNLTNIPAVKAIFVMQLIAGATVYAAVAAGLTPKSADALMEKMQETQSTHTVALAHHSTQFTQMQATLGDHSTQLMQLQETQSTHSAQLMQLQETQSTHTAVLADHSTQLTKITTQLTVIQDMLSKLANPVCTGTGIPSHWQPLQALSVAGSESLSMVEAMALAGHSSQPEVPVEPPLTGGGTDRGPLAGGA